MNNLKLLPAEERAEEVSEMLQDLIDSGVTYEEIGAAIPCSRMTLINWINKAHPPRERNVEAIQRVYEKFSDRLYSVPAKRMINALLRRGLSEKAIKRRLQVSDATFEGWINSDRKPLEGSLRALRELYTKARRVAA